MVYRVALTAASVGIMALASATCAAEAEDPVSRAREKELVHLVLHDCGSCHGLTLRGGLGPPLTAEALRARPVAYIKAMILDGRPGTAMPHWRPLLREAEAAWIAEKLLQGMPDAK
ncbi:MAG: c-type cytochrome [Betaproteobacteria bacterium]